MPVPKAVRREAEKKKAEGEDYVPPKNCGEPVVGAPLPGEGENNLYTLSVKSSRRKQLRGGPTLSITAKAASGRQYWFGFPHETPDIQKSDEITVRGSPNGGFNFGGGADEGYHKLKGIAPDSSPTLVQIKRKNGSIMNEAEISDFSKGILWKDPEPPVPIVTTYSPTPKAFPGMDDDSNSSSMDTELDREVTNLVTRYGARRVLKRLSEII